MFAAMSDVINLYSEPHTCGQFDMLRSWVMDDFLSVVYSFSVGYDEFNGPCQK